MPYTNKQHAVDTLMGPGWTISGQQPNMVTVPNPAYGNPAIYPPPPATIQEQQGEVLTVVGPAGSPPDTIIIKQVGNAPWKGGVGWDVLQGPSKTQPKPEATATPPSGMVRLDDNYTIITNPSQQATYVVDPKAPPGTAPYKLADDAKTGDPSKWSVVPADPADANGPKLVYDAQSSKIVATIPATAGSRASGEYANVVDPNDPTGKRIIGLKDTGSNQIFSVSADPTLRKQVVTTPTKVLVLDDNGQVVNTIDVDPSAVNQQAVVIDGQAYAFNPKDGTFVKGPTGTDAATLSIDTTAPELIWYDKQGQEVSRQTNTNYKAPRPTLPAQSLTAPSVPIEDPNNPGKIIWIANEGRVTIGQATQNLIKDLTGQTVDPDHPMTLDEAKTVIDGAVAKMNAEASKARTEVEQAGVARSAAGDILTAQSQGAQTGAGLLNQRAQVAQGLVQQGLGLVGQGASRSGNYGGGMLTAPQGFGEGLAGGAAAYATELGGGQAVYDTAVRMVQAADPQGQNPDRAAAVATLTQIMSRYQQSTGQEFPTVAATRAMQGSQQAGGLQAPMTAPAVAPVALPPPLATEPWQRADQQFGAAPQGAGLAPPGVAGTVAPGSPMYVGAAADLVAKRRALGQPGFMAPNTLADLTQGLGYSSARY